MWDAVLEWCTGLFGVTQRGRVWQLFALAAVVFVLGLAMSLRWGVVGALLPSVIFAIGVVGAVLVTRARDRLWRAACAPIAELDVHEEGPRAIGPPTADALDRLAEAVSAVRRRAYADARTAAELVDRARLRSEEIHLLEAVRALVSLGLGDPERAAQRAAVALPTGSEDFDAHLGRTLVRGAWNDPSRLTATLAAWNRVGVSGGATPLGKLERLVRLRIDPSAGDDIASAEARALAEEARAIGDDEMAAELDVKARASVYR